jgi:hypothetical protein
MLDLYLSAWTAACFWGPGLTPVIAAFAVQAEEYVPFDSTLGHQGRRLTLPKLALVHVGAPMA